MKIPVTCEYLETLGKFAIENGTQDAFIALAIEWAKVANDHIMKQKERAIELCELEAKSYEDKPFLTEAGKAVYNTMAVGARNCKAALEAL